MNFKTTNSGEEELNSKDGESDSSRFTHVSFGSTNELRNFYSFENSGDINSDTVTVQSIEYESTEDGGECSG